MILLKWLIIANGRCQNTSLEFMARKRYLEKLKINGCELQDPFGIDEDQWFEDLTQWPKLEFGDCTHI